MNNVKKKRTNNIKRNAGEAVFIPQFNVRNEASANDDFLVSSIVDAAFGKLKPRAFAFPKGIKIDLAH